MSDMNIAGLNRSREQTVKDIIKLLDVNDNEEGDTVTPATLDVNVTVWVFVGALSSFIVKVSLSPLAIFVLDFDKIILP